MEWADIINGALSVGSGGIFGLLGSAVGVVAKYFQERQRQNWEREKWSHETELLRLNMEARSQETEQELAIVSQQGSWQGLSESVKADKSLSAKVHTWVNDIRGLFRPALTVMLWVLAALVFYRIAAADAAGFLIDWLGKADILAIVKYMVYTVFFCASSATMWWFGDRALTPPDMKNK